MRILDTFMAAALLFVINGCAEPRPRIVHTKPFPKSIAILPPDNHSNSLLGPVLLRKLVEDYLSASSLEVQDTKETDRLLRTAGITDGGQIRSITPKKLGELLEVEALLYGELLDFGYTNIGVLSKRSVSARMFLVDSATGEKLWDATKQEAKSTAALSADAIKENFAIGLGTKLLETAMQSPLRPETETVAHDLLRDLADAKAEWQ